MEENKRVLRWTPTVHYPLPLSPPGWSYAPRPTPPGGPSVGGGRRFSPYRLRGGAMLPGRRPLEGPPSGEREDFPSIDDRDDNLTSKPEIRHVPNTMGASAGEYFDPWVQPALDLKFCGCGYEFLFQPVGDPHLTQNFVHSLVCAKMFKIQW
jgi:hypothetical protein